MIVALTTASLDITLGVAWWTLKQVFSGALYIGTYIFSESSSNKKNKILGDDPNFVPHAFEIVELELTHSHTTINNCDELKKSDKEPSECDGDFIEISKTESILTSKSKYYKIPLIDIIKRKDKLPLWFISFVNTFPLTNYAIVNSTNNSFVTRLINTPIYSPFTLSKHLYINKQNLENLYIYLSHDDVEETIQQILKTNL
jgi:hypothetical protein